VDKIKNPAKPYFIGITIVSPHIYPTLIHELSTKLSTYVDNLWKNRV